MFDMCTVLAKRAERQPRSGPSRQQSRHVGRRLWDNCAGSQPVRWLWRRARGAAPAPLSVYRLKQSPAALDADRVEALGPHAADARAGPDERPRGYIFASSSPRGSSRDGKHRT